MRRFTLFFDPDEEKAVREKVLPFFEGHAVGARAFDPEAIPESDADTVLVTYLSDDPQGLAIMHGCACPNRA